MSLMFFIFFFKQKTAYEMRISNWSSDVCSSDLGEEFRRVAHAFEEQREDADPVVIDQRVHDLGGIEIGLVAGRDPMAEPDQILHRAAEHRPADPAALRDEGDVDRKSTRLNSSH